MNFLDTGSQFYNIFVSHSLVFLKNVEHAANRSSGRNNKRIMVLMVPGSKKYLLLLSEK